MLEKRQSRWISVVQMLYTCFVFAGIVEIIVILHQHLLKKKRYIKLV